MSYHFLNFKLEDTLKNYIQSIVGPSCPVWGFGDLIDTDSELAEPWIGVHCSSSKPHADVQWDTSDGNRYFDCTVAIRTHAEHTFDTDGITVLGRGRDVHADLCGQVLDSFCTGTIRADLNSAAQSVGGISINEVDQPDIATGNEDRSFVTTIKFQILCNPTQ